MKIKISAILCLLFACFTASPVIASSSPGRDIIWDTPMPGEGAQCTAARVVIMKSTRTMLLLDQDGRTLRTYRVALGRNPLGTKIREGDGKTPEGRYTIEGRNPNSSYFLSLRISYPSPQDRLRAQKMSVSPGGEIFIHGLPNGREWMKWKYNSRRDWTNGCIAVSNKEMLDIWNIVPDGTEIVILP